MPPGKKHKNDVGVLERKAQALTFSPPSDSIEERSRRVSPRTRSRSQKVDATSTDGEAQVNAADPKRRNTRRKYGGGGTTTADAAAVDMATGAQPSGLPAKPRGSAPKSYTADSDIIMEAVVKVFCVHTEPNYSLPWQRKRQYSSSSSGFVLPGRRILTNAHCVDHYTQVKVKRRGSDVKHVASVLSVGTECDIASSLCATAGTGGYV
ncbi:hypothetical protein Vafri_18424 [Volvox africanus]|uniref:Peptidase S1 domain-containing protein n=1 Tax=Volvox africanus TaxID=51714 RepID=A0A8J4F7N2_9CHLO|nr:hypothetical protein Vafri_18424 [Volvox africanus]